MAGFSPISGLLALMCLCVTFTSFAPPMLVAADELVGVDPSAWWRQGLIYQVYPRSFKDGCSPKCTGTGSLKGITSKLEYLRDVVGVTAIWISPIYDSPMADFGYDISNYTAIWPTFGTMKDFDDLMAAAKRLGMRILMDYVPNHTSDQHEWFLHSKSSRDSPYRDWYVWRDGTDSNNGTKLPPNNWRTLFCPDAKCYGWTYDNTTDQWYYHAFLKEQPDLNWRNPDVRKAMHDVLRFWLKKGVDGFRVDAFVNLLEDTKFRDEPINPDWHGDPVADGYWKLRHIYTENVDGLHDIVREMQDVIREFGDDKMMIGEIYADQVVTEEDVISYYGKSPKEPEFNMPFNMNLISFFTYVGSFDPSIHNNPRNATKLREMIDHYDSSLPAWAQPNYVLGNHDVHRIASRLNDTDLSRVAHVLLLTLRGTPTVYNGDEFGQLDGFVSKSRCQDPNCCIDISGSRCRDPERTPLQWNKDNKNAGFSGENVETWLPVSSDYVHINVADETYDPKSMLNLFSRAIKLRTKEQCLHSGLYKSIGDTVVKPSDAQTNIFAFYRYNNTHDYFAVVANLGTSKAMVDISRAFDTVTLSNAMLDSLNGSVVNEPVDITNLTMHPAHAMVIHIVQKPNHNVTVFAIAAAAMGVLVIGLAIILVKYGRRRQGVISEDGQINTMVEERATLMDNMDPDDED